MKKIYTIIISLVVTAMSLGQPTPVVSISLDEITPLCNATDCVAFHANYTNVNSTTDYTVGSIAYAPSFPFTGGAIIPPTGDDLWSPEFSLPFNFCFYGNTYNKVLIGTNGVITFDIIGQFPGGYCNWPFTTVIPVTNFPIKNAIYGVYQDTDIRSEVIAEDATPDAIQNVNYYVLDAGVNAAPNRVFIANFNELPHFACQSELGLQTSQIVLHETTNVIEVFVSKRTSCIEWNSGSGLIGVLNQAGTMATVPPARNTGTWSTTNEAWRFTPSGPSVTQLSWSMNGVQLPSTDNPLVLCNVADSVIRGTVTYTNCDGTFTTISSEELIPTVQPEPAFAEPIDISVCQNQGPFTTDLTNNIPIVLAALNPDDYGFLFYHTFEDAQNQTFTYIVDAENYSFTANEIIYMSISDITTGCIYVKPFNLIVSAVDAPVALSVQLYTVGQTLLDLDVAGENIQWYDSAVGGNLLPSSTLLQNMTYYASQTISDCESETVAITATDVLATSTFNNNLLAVFPNPVRNVLNIKYIENIKLVEVYNAIGQLVLANSPDEKNVKLDMASIDSGIYFVKIHCGSKEKIVKVIKN